MTIRRSSPGFEAARDTAMALVRLSPRLTRLEIYPSMAIVPVEGLHRLLRDCAFQRRAYGRLYPPVGLHIERRRSRGSQLGRSRQREAPRRDLESWFVLPVTLRALALA